MIKDKDLETDAAFRKRLGISYGTNQARKDYRRWRKKVRADFSLDDFKDPYNRGSYVNVAKSKRILEI